MKFEKFSFLKFLDDKGFAKHQLDSYNRFVRSGVQAIINSLGEIRPEIPTGEEVVIKLGKVKFDPPTIREMDGFSKILLPNEARMRNLTYSSKVRVTMTPIIDGIKEESEDVIIGEIPVMVKSILCPTSKMGYEELKKHNEDPDDPGGYFIVNGNEKVIVSIEELANNKPIYLRDAREELCRINSESNGYVQRHVIRRRGGISYISFAGVKGVPAVVILRALGLETDKEIVDVISEKYIGEIYLNIYESNVLTRQDAIDIIAKNAGVLRDKEERVMQILDRYLLPHLGQREEDRGKKALTLGKMIKNLIALGHGEIFADDVDHYANKRLRLVGDLLEVLFRSVFLGKWGFVARMKYNFQKGIKRGRLPSLQSTAVADMTTKQINSAMSTGTWIGGRTGVSQRLERNNLCKTLEHLRTVVSPLSSQRQHFEARELHPTHWGRIDPIRTPEGVNIGLRKHLASFAEITVGLGNDERNELKKALLSLVCPGDCDIYLDGEIIGSCDDGRKIERFVIEGRRKGHIPREVNVCFDTDRNEVRIITDSGRVRRPVIIIENGESKMEEHHIEKLEKGLLTVKDLEKMGIVEYLDAEEEENALIALKPEDVTPKHTHLELDPATIYGLSASLVVYPEYNRGDRVNYGSKMCTQGIGMYSKNFLARYDTNANVLAYGQKPIVKTQTTDKLISKYPIGQNMVVAIACYDGYNIEDAIIMNKASIERGLARIYHFDTYVAEARRYWGGQKDVIGIPDKDVRGYKSEEDYSLLDLDGIVHPETYVKENCVLVGRVSPPKFLGSGEEIKLGLESKRETSVSVKGGEKGIVDSVLLTETSDGDKLIKIRLREERIPELGDKFATRHGQKGVIGLIISQEDMPFTSKGIVPDLILSTHAIPSRMTISQLKEIIAGKAAALRGEETDGTAFHAEKEDSFIKIFERFGFRYDGKERLFNGITGEVMEAHILIGPAFYLRLEHMVADKIHARSRGPVTLLTKQPTAGRSREGGLRLGEMEKDCLVAHGAALLLKERFSSDMTTFHVCRNCGNPAFYDRRRAKYYCPECRLKPDVVEIKAPQAFLLLLDEMRSLLISTKLRIKENSCEVDSLEFGLMGPEDMRKLGVKEITKTEVYDADGYPVEGGVMDPALGVIDPAMTCATCKGTMRDCKGHFGYIELAEPIVHVLYVKRIKTLLSRICRKCQALLPKENDVISKKCPECGEKQEEIKFDRPYFFYEGNKPLHPSEIRRRFQNIKDEDLKKIKFNGGRPEWLILTVIPVPPVTIRPSITLETGERSEDDLTHKLVDIIRINQRLKANKEIGAPEFIIEDLCELLQYHVSTLFNNELSGIPPARHRSGRALKGLIDRLGGKEGRFRQNLIGKRANFSARTVISPDPNIAPNEVGVPLAVAKELTVPVPVIKNNVEKVREWVENAGKYPGANYVVREDGTKKKITEENKQTILEELKPGYIVERHLLDGDIVLFNRQPSLHRMSMMGHRVRILPYRTFRLNPVVCVAPNTLVQLSSGIQRKIDDLKNCWKESKLSTYDWGKRTIISTELKKFWGLKPEEYGIKCFKIKTKETGREITVTEDHPFYTNNGIKRARDITLGEKVVVRPFETPLYEDIDKTIIEEEDFKMAKTYMERSLKVLKELKLIPFNLRDQRSMAIARILGHLFGKGTFILKGHAAKMIFRGAKEDLEMMLEDIRSLGFGAEKIYIKNHAGEIQTIKGKTLKFKESGASFEVRNKPLALLFNALGAPNGDKVKSDFSVPKWILESPKHIKREFLGAYFGGKLSRPILRNNSKTDFRRLKFKLFKIEEKVSSGIKFIKDIEKMLREFGIEISKISKEPGNMRKGAKTVYLVANISNKSISNLFGRIGYIYAKSKDNIARLAYQYSVLKRKIEKKAHSRKRFFDFSVYEKHNAGINFIGFEEWRKKATLGLDGGLVWETVSEKSEEYCPFVYDITTTAETHNFFANGFLTKNCAPYNADFDGDEMNLHVPQAEEARTEAKELLAVENHLKSSKTGEVTIGNIQDSISGLYLLSNTNVSKELAVNLLNEIGIYDFSLPNKKEIPGKEIIKQTLNCFGIKNAQKFLNGKLDSKIVGKGGSLMREILEENGKDIFIEFLGKISLLGAKYLTYRGFSISTSDFDIPEEANRKISEVIKKGEEEIKEIIEKYYAGKIEKLPGRTLEETLEAMVTLRLRNITNDVKDIVSEYLPETNARIMAESGARGSMTNLALISGLLGQETVGGKRISRGYKYRTTSHFERNDLGPRARGFVYNSILSGLDPIECFYDVMSQREGLMDTSLRTRISGYMYRRLSNAMQDLRTDFNNVVRDSTGKIIQFVAGGDGIDPSKYKVMKMLEKNEMIWDGRRFDSGEAIGILAAQSISEPATQMTMETYHIAGGAKASVTLGLPRLIEIVDARRIPKTPSMTIFLADKYNNLDSAKKVAAKIKEIKFEDIIQRSEFNLLDMSLEFKLDEELLSEYNIGIDYVKGMLLKGKLNTIIKAKDNKLSIKPKKDKYNLADLQKIKKKIEPMHIKGIKGVREVSLIREGDNWKIITFGTNLKKILEMEEVDGKRTRSNNIFEVQKILGIEAARSLIVEEISEVLRNQGIEVDPRWINLISDVMTADGEIKGVTRYGIVGDKDSILARASFEETKKHLINAAIRGSVDKLNSVVENVIFGKIIPLGTGMYKLRSKIK